MRRDATSPSSTTTISPFATGSSSSPASPSSVPVRSYGPGCATHAIDEEAWDCGVGYRQTGPTQTPYPLAFDLFDHMVENSTPNCSVAIPKSSFTDNGVSFDDSLPVLEDWDVLMRTSLLCGLVSTPEVTSLYRRWRRGFASHVEHSEAQWETAKQSVRGRLDGRAFLVPPGTVTRVVQLQGEVVSLTESVSSLEARVEELQLERDELSARFEDTERTLAERVTEMGELLSLPSVRLPRLQRRRETDQRLSEMTALPTVGRGSLGEC